MAEPGRDDPVERLVEALARIPGLGRRSARRAALRLLTEPERLLHPLRSALKAAADSVRPCSECGNLDATDPCGICADASRERKSLCVVETVADVWALERARAHRGLYHVLGGVLSPIAGVTPESLALPALLRRVEALGVVEVILALPATVDGAATAHYVTDRLAGRSIVITRPAQGVPIGGALDVLDEGTIAAALKGRRPL
jgi:recombination protein RecR